MTVCKHRLAHGSHGRAVVKPDRRLGLRRIIGPGYANRYILAVQKLIDRRIARMTDQKQPICATRDQGANLLGFQVGLVGGTGHQQRGTRAAQLLLHRLNAAGENGIFHRRNDRADRVGALGGQRLGREIWGIAEVLHRFHHAVPRFLLDLTGGIEAPRHGRRGDARLACHVGQCGHDFRRLCSLRHLGTCDTSSGGGWKYSPLPKKM